MQNYSRKVHKGITVHPLCYCATRGYGFGALLKFHNICFRLIHQQVPKLSHLMLFYCTFKLRSTWAQRFLLRVVPVKTFPPHRDAAGIWNIILHAWMDLQYHWLFLIIKHMVHRMKPCWGHVTFSLFTYCEIVLVPPRSPTTFHSSLQHPRHFFVLCPKSTGCSGVSWGNPLGQISAESRRSCLSDGLSSLGAEVH